MTKVKKFSRQESINMARAAGLLLVTDTRPNMTTYHAAAVVIMAGKIIRNRYGDVDPA